MQKERSAPQNLQEKRIVGVRMVGVSPTYNVTMQAPFHNYFINNILTANSHSVCYGILAYQTAWLRTHYPSHFWAAVLSSESDDSEKVGHYVSCARKQGVVVLRPDINLSESRFVASGGTVRFGLRAIRGVGESAVSAILQARREHGHFHSIDDIIRRTDTRTVQRRVLENLVRAGACDGFNGHRAGHLAAIGDLMGQSGKSARSTTGSPGLFGSEMESGSSGRKEKCSDRGTEAPEWSEKEMLLEEKKVLGVCLSHHPVADFKTAITEKGGQPLDEIRGKAAGSKVCIGGYVSHVTVKTTRNGQRFAVVQLEDGTGEMNVVIWPNVFRRHERCVEEGNVILVSGRLPVEDRLPVRVVAEYVEVLNMGRSEALQPSSGMNTMPAMQVVLHFTANTLSGEDMERLRDVIYHHRGPFRLLFSLTLENGWVVRLRAAAGFNVSASRTFHDEIKKKFPGVELTREREI